MEAKTKQEWISLAEMQEILSIGKTKAYELVASGEVPSVRIGRSIRVNRAELESWIEGQRYLDTRRNEV